MKQFTILAVLSSAVLTAAHGIVSELRIAETVYGGYNPYQDPYMNPAPQRIVWAFPSAGNGPVEDVSSSDITCNKGATEAPISAEVAVGSSITFFWTTWPESHKGPSMTYLAPTDSYSVDPTTLDFFKIDHAGLNADGTFVSDDIIKNNNSYTITIPSDIAPGNYILRHELLALHAASSPNGAQFYPMCANLVVTGSGTAKPAGVKFPGAYKATDPGILVNIYQGLTSYTIPGPDVYTGSIIAVPTTTSPSPTSKAVAVPTATTFSITTRPTTTSPSSTSKVAAVPTTTTFSTTIRPTTTTSAAATVKKTSQDINKCLDKVNACIRKVHAASPRGGPVDFTACEAQRAACYP